MYWDKTVAIKGRAKRTAVSISVSPTVEQIGFSRIVFV